MRHTGLDGGNHPPTLAEVSSNLKAGVDWVGKRDLPDIEEWADFVAVPELVHRRLVSRIDEGRCPSLAHAFPLSKPGKAEVRRMAWLHPYDELYSRIVVGRVAPAIEAALGPDVFSHRLAAELPAWSVQDPREAFRLRLARGKALLADEGCNALAVTDLRHYYPSITAGVLVEALHRTASPRGAVTLIGELLRELEAMGAPAGLPIGPEASGLLGNILLLSVDEAISDLAQGHVRYMDDSWMFLQAENEWSGVYEAYTVSAAALGLEVNTAKVALYEKGSPAAVNAMQHEQIAYLVSGASPYRTPETSVEDLRAQLDGQEPDWSLVGFHLGSLRHARSTHGLAVLYDHPEILQEVPRHAGHYLSSVASSKRSRGKVDPDWLVDQVTGPRTSRSLAGQLQACRVASRLQLSNEHGKRLEQLATDSSPGCQVPLQAWAAKAWGSSKAHSPGRAVEYACHFGDFSVRRAFALTIDPASSTPSRRSCWRRKLKSVDADLEPTLARIR